MARCRERGRCGRGAGVGRSTYAGVVVGGGRASGEVGRRRGDSATGRRGPCGWGRVSGARDSRVGWKALVGDFRDARSATGGGRESVRGRGDHRGAGVTSFGGRARVGRDRTRGASPGPGEGDLEWARTSGRGEALHLRGAPMAGRGGIGAWRPHLDAEVRSRPGRSGGCWRRAPLRAQLLVAGRIPPGAALGASGRGFLDLRPQVFSVV